jgi:hypothetical protein
MFINDAKGVEFKGFRPINVILAYAYIFKVYTSCSIGMKRNGISSALSVILLLREDRFVLT